MKKILYVALMLLLTAIIAVVWMLVANFSRSCDVYARTGVQAQVTSMMNRTVAEYLLQNKKLCNELCTLSRKEDGSISSLTVDGLKLSAMGCQLSDLIFENLKKTETSYGIPLGSAIGSKTFSGRGPTIPVTVVPVGAVATQNTGEFLSGGVNQTLYRVGLRFSVTLDCIAPFYNCSSVATVDITITETVISGEVPQVVWR